MTDRLANLLKSVDWSKMVSGPDARNALLGSALGGALLGGASLVGDHDPEESKYAPVGDALLGALLGGVAGYGIPKGLSLFRDSGTLAPNGDQLPPHNYTAAGIKGLGLGLAAGTGIGVATPYLRAKAKLRDAASRAFAERGRELDSKLQAATASVQALGSDAPKALRDETMRAYRDARVEHATFGSQREFDTLRRRLTNLRNRTWDSGNVDAHASFADQLRRLVEGRRNATRGYATVSGVLSNIGHGHSDPVKGQPFRNILRRLSSGRPLVPAFNASGSVDPARVAKLMGKRVGKWGGAGLLAGLLLHKVFGPSPTNNFKN